MGHVLSWLHSCGSACPLRKISNTGNVHGPPREGPGREEAASPFLSSISHIKELGIAKIQTGNKTTEKSIHTFLCSPNNCW